VNHGRLHRRSLMRGPTRALDDVPGDSPQSRQLGFPQNGIVEVCIVVAIAQLAEGSAGCSKIRRPGMSGAPVFLGSFPQVCLGMVPGEYSFLRVEACSRNAKVPEERTRERPPQRGMRERRTARRHFGIVKRESKRSSARGMFVARLETSAWSGFRQKKSIKPWSISAASECRRDAAAGARSLAPRAGLGGAGGGGRCKSFRIARCVQACRLRPVAVGLEVAVVSPVWYTEAGGPVSRQFTSDLASSRLSANRVYRRETSRPPSRHFCEWIGRGWGVASRPGNFPDGEQFVHAPHESDVVIFRPLICQLALQMAARCDPAQRDHWGGKSAAARTKSDNPTSNHGF